MNLPPAIFTAYDIRGIVRRTLTAPVVRSIGQALGTLALEHGRDTIAIGRDGRLSGPELAAALAQAIRAAGANVVDLGMVRASSNVSFRHKRIVFCCDRAVNACSSWSRSRSLIPRAAEHTLAGACVVSLDSMRRNASIGVSSTISKEPVEGRSDGSLFRRSRQHLFGGARAVIGRKLGHYRLLESIGRGGMGVVYRARDEQLHRDVAVKVLHEGAVSDAAARSRLRQEAILLSKVNHPNVAVIHYLSCRV